MPQLPQGFTGKNRSGVYQPPRRVAVGQAWEYPSLEIGRSATARTAIVLDCDGPAATERATDWFLANEAHWFNWSVVRRSSGGTHFVLCLERPVLIGPNALSGPQLKLKRITGWLVDQTGADPANLGDMSHNPMARPQGPNLSTTWGRQEPHRLDDLGGLVPPDWQPPELEGTGNGRNDDFNRELAKWAASPENVHQSVLDHALALYWSMPAEWREFPHPFTENEVRSIARSVEKYRRQLMAEGEFGPAGQTKRSNWGKRRGKASGRVRRKATRERDDAILVAYMGGESITAIGRRLGLSRPTIRAAIKRVGNPVRRKPISELKRKPWDWLGVSERTFYRDFFFMENLGRPERASRRAFAPAPAEPLSSVDQSQLQPQIRPSRI